MGKKTPRIQKTRAERIENGRLSYKRDGWFAFIAIAVLFTTMAGVGLTVAPWVRSVATIATVLFTSLAVAGTLAHKWRDDMDEHLDTERQTIVDEIACRAAKAMEATANAGFLTALLSPRRLSKSDSGTPEEIRDLGRIAQIRAEINLVVVRISRLAAMALLIAAFSGGVSASTALASLLGIP